jgi:hypothetical protein
MRNKILYSLIIILLSSCKKDDFLNMVPDSQISSATFWRNEADAMGALTGVYDSWSIQEGFGPRALYLGAWADEGTTSDFWNGYWYNTWTGNISPQDAFISSYWTEIYASIRKANVFLANISKPEMDESTRKMMTAEARFIRAYNYMLLLQTWGNVPIVDKPLALDELKIPQSTPDQTLAFIVNDLTLAIPDLPVNQAKGRIKKGAALALLARVNLYNGNWTEAAAAAKQLMDLNAYDLYQTPAGDGFEKQFVTDENPEVLCAWTYDHDKRPNERGGLLTWWTWWAGGELLSPTEALSRAFETYDPASDQIVPYNPANPYVNRDPRFGYTIQTGVGTSTGYGVRKFLNTTDAQEIIIIRYAEVLLTYAEAKIEANQIDQSVLDAINRVRARAYGVAVTDVAHYPEITTTDQAALRAIVRNEREVELAFEGLRWYDIIRWKTAESVLNGPVLGAGGIVSKTRVFAAPRDYLRPIPQSEIDLMGSSLLHQNPGY